MSLESDIIKARHNRPNSGIGCAPITLGAALDSPTRAIHCNVGGTAILTFTDGSSGTFVLQEGGRYDYMITKAATSGGTNPTLIAIF
jgi:hypothetical protein